MSTFTNNGHITEELDTYLNKYDTRFDIMDNYFNLFYELVYIINNNNNNINMEYLLFLQKFNSRKTSGPDNMLSLLLKSCHNQLANAYIYIYI